MAKNHSIRTPEGGLMEVTLTPSLAIKCFCTECMGWDSKPGDCTAQNCPLFPFRGKSLAYRGKREIDLSDEQRDEAVERLRKAREAKGSNASE